MQLRLHIAPVLRVGIHHLREKQLAAGVRWRQWVSAATVTTDADGRHRLGRTSIQADGGQSRTRHRIEGVELVEIAIGRAASGTGEGPRAELDGVGPQVPLRNLLDRCLEVERRITTIRPDEIVLDNERHGSVRVQVRRHAASVAQIALVADGDGVFGVAAGDYTDVVG